MARQWPCGASQLCRDGLRNTGDSGNTRDSRQNVAPPAVSRWYSPGLTAISGHQRSRTALEYDSDPNCRAYSEQSEIVSDIYRDKSIAALEQLFRRIRGDRRALTELRDELGRRGSERARRLAVVVEESMHAEHTARAVREGPPPDYLPARRAKPRTLPGDDPMSEPPPPCPSCGAPLVLRTAKTGRNAGGRFWGCPQFPRCRGTRDFSSESVRGDPIAFRC